MGQAPRNSEPVPVLFVKRERDFEAYRPQTALLFEARLNEVEERTKAGRAPRNSEPVPVLVSFCILRQRY